MSQTKAHPAHELKPHTDAKEGANSASGADLNAHILGEAPADTIPVPEEGGKARSHAAHLHVPGNVHSEPAGADRQGASHGADPGALRQPASIAERSGKQHR